MQTHAAEDIVPFRLVSLMVNPETVKSAVVKLGASLASLGDYIAIVVGGDPCHTIPAVWSGAPAPQFRNCSRAGGR